MRRAWVLMIPAAAVAGSLIMASASGLQVTSKDLTVLSITATPPLSGDTTPPALVALEPLKMYDDDADGKVDRVTVTFNENLAAYTAEIAPWTLTAPPSGATLNSVSVSGQVATLTLNEGSGPQDTAVGAFTIALAANSNGIRDAAGNQSSFTARAPADKAGPVATNLATTSIGGGSESGSPQPGETLSITFSEKLKASSICPFWISDTANQSVTGVTVTFGNNAASSGNDNLTFSGCSTSLHIGELDLGDTGYVTSGAGQDFTSSAVAWNPSTKVVTITLGTGSTNRVNANLDRVFTPSPLLTDLAGNAGTGEHPQKLQMF